MNNSKNKLKRFGYYLRLWGIMTKNAFLVYTTKKILISIFMLGKLLRFGFFLAFLFFIVQGSGSLAGYSINQTMLFFLTFNLIDVIGQFLYREVYHFRGLIITGGFDMVLTKPYNALFRVLMGGADVIDLMTIPPLIAGTIYVGQQLSPTSAQTLLYIMLLLNGLVIATAFHIAVASLGIVTLEIDHTVMIFRDLMNLGRFPIEIYREPIRGILTYLIPVGVMITIPAKVLFGIVSPLGVVISLLVGALAIILSVRFWNYALRFYSSASS